MILDLKKLFPNSCSQMGILSTHFDYQDINTFARKELPVVGFKGSSIYQDVIQLKEGLTYRFPAIDNGIEVLKEISAAYNVLNAWTSNKDLAGPEILNELSQRKDSAVKVLADCALKFV